MSRPRAATSVHSKHAPVVVAANAESAASRCACFIFPCSATTASVAPAAGLTPSSSSPANGSAGPPALSAVW
eukprot:30826-Pelagococcus_subviridis.AAC.4